jgi:6-phosphofructokinase 1
MVFNNGIQYLAEEDYTAAREYLDNPEEFDFKKILNW